MATRELTKAEEGYLKQLNLSAKQEEEVRKVWQSLLRPKDEGPEKPKDELIAATSRFGDGISIFDALLLTALTVNYFYPNVLQQYSAFLSFAVYSYTAITVLLVAVGCAVFSFYLFGLGGYPPLGHAGLLLLLKNKKSVQNWFSQLNSWIYPILLVLNHFIVSAVIMFLCYLLITSFMWLTKYKARQAIKAIE